MPWPCADCGGENPDGTRFCGHCGKPHAVPAAAAAPPAGPDLQATVADVAEVLSSALAGDRTDADRGAVVNAPLVERLASARVGVEERRLITAVFADVSGFTRLAHGLDAEQLVGIIGPIVSRLADIVTRYGGYVGKFAGDAILAFFGAPVSHEDDAVRALLAARDMQRESGELFAGLGPEAAHLTLHVGVNTGYVVAGFFGDEVRMEYSVLGDAVNVAQRLESAAPGGAIYVGRDTYELARSRFVFEDLGGIEVKGKPEPIPCWRLVAEAAGGAGAGAGQPSARLVGRGRELATLTGTLAPAAGGGGVVAVVGEPGTGKSALLQEARRQGTAGGAQWVETHCVPYRSRPYRPYVELLRVLTAIPEDVEPAIAAARIAEEAARFGVPEAAPYFLRLLGLPPTPGAEGSTPADPLAFRHGLHDAVGAYLVARAADRPLGLAVEDVHWADEGTLDLTRDLVARSRRAPLSIVLTARPEGRAIAAELVEGHERSAVVDLGALDDVAVRELAAEGLGGPASSLLAEIVGERTSGNPLFAQQLLRSLLDQGALEQGADGWGLRPGWNVEAVPTAVEQVLAARIDMLPRPAADLLQIASVIGRDLQPALLRRVAAEPGRVHDQAVELLVDGGFLDPVDDGGDLRLSFHHALLVDVAYGRLLRARRKQIHRQVVAAAVELYGSGDDVVDMLARHAHRGDMGAPAVAYLERAGARAASLFANEQAAGYLRQAIGIAERDAEAEDRLPALLLGCAGVEETRGAYREALELYERALALGGDVRAALGRVSTLRKLGELKRCRELLDGIRASRADLEPDEAAGLALEEGWVLGLTGDYGGAVRVLSDGVRAVDGHAGRSLVAGLLVALARNEQGTEDFEDALAHAQRARDLLEEEGDLPGQATALRVLGGVENSLARDDAGLQRSRETLERALALARRVGNAEEAAAALINLATTLASLRLFDEALRCDLEAVEAFAAVGLKSGVACAYCNLADHLGEKELWPESREAALKGLAIAEEIGNVYWITGARNGIAEAALHTGDLREAVRAGEASLDLSLAAPMPARARAALRTTVDALRLLGDGEAEARVLAKARAAGITPEAPDAGSAPAAVAPAATDA